MQLKKMVVFGGRANTEFRGQPMRNRVTENKKILTSNTERSVTYCDQPLDFIEKILISKDQSGYIKRDIWATVLD